MKALPSECDLVKLAISLPKIMASFYKMRHWTKCFLWSLPNQTSNFKIRRAMGEKGI